jgi:hypothetical protein
VLLTDQILALQTADLFALSTSQVAAFTSTQAVVMTTTQVESFSTAQIAAFSTAAYGQLATGTPIILDLNGDGVKTLGISAGVKFDLFGTGTAVNTGWVSSGDGLLVLDRNHDGQINSGSELFGSATRLANGLTAPDGYAALRELDTNHDGVIDRQDAAYGDLKVWIDSNSDGVTEAGELKTLASLNIATVGVNAQVGTATDNGNLLGLTSTYQTTDGASHSAADVWFLADKASSVVPAVALAAAPEVTANANTNTNTSGVALASAMQLNVSALAHAIGSFADTMPIAGGSATGASLTSQAANPLANSPTVAAVANMADVMKQFDANGNPGGAPGTTVNLSVLPGANGLLGQAANPAAPALFVGSSK